MSRPSNWWRYQCGRGYEPTIVVGRRVLTILVGIWITPYDDLCGCFRDGLLPEAANAISGRMEKSRIWGQTPISAAPINRSLSPYSPIPLTAPVITTHNLSLNARAARTALRKNK